MTELDVVDPFGGPGGWSVACAELGLREVGYEWDDAACRTRAAAGHLTIRQDVTTCDPRRWRGIPGLIASPPCPDFSAAGKRAGRSGESGRLIDLVPLWVKAMQPEWIACEQVPEALPVWREHAHDYRAMGYSVWTGVLEAERFGVPQTRDRAILMAHRTRAVVPPEPTHQQYVPGVAQGAAEECQPSMFGPGLTPWVSMADALGWGVDWVVDRRTNSKAAGWQHGADMVPTVPVPMSRPAPTLTGKAGGQWVFERPSTTVCGDCRIGHPGHPGHRDRAGGERQFGEDTIKLTVEEGSILQSFPPDYPWQGNKGQKFQQIGNAVPPLLARRILAALTPREER